VAVRHLREPAEAEKLRTKFLRQVDEKKASRTRASLGALIEEWLPGAELGANTRANYAGLIERFIRLAPGALPLTTLTPQRIERFYTELRRCRARCDGQPFLEHRQSGEHDCVKARADRTNASRWRPPRCWCCTPSSAERSRPPSCGSGPASMSPARLDD
jgi:integrase